jgi:folate-binding protein YgfZ
MATSEVGSTALRLSGRDALPLLHRVTSNALDDLQPGDARATLWCDFRGRLQFRIVVAVAADTTVWLLRADAPGAELAAALEKSIFRDDVRIEDASAAHPFVLARGTTGESGLLAETNGAPSIVSTGDGTRLVRTGTAEALTEAERIVLLHPRHGHEIVEAFNPFEVGLAHEVHLAKGCFTGQEALQRLITYESVRRRPARVHLPGAAPALPCDVFAKGDAPGERAGVLTSLDGVEGFAILRSGELESGADFALADGRALEVIAAPEPARPLGRP